MNARGEGVYSKTHKIPMKIRWRKYRPKPEKVMDVLLQRFCMKCLRIRGIERSFKLILSKCGGCPVFQALVAVNPRLEWVRRELKELQKTMETIKR